MTTLLPTSGSAYSGSLAASNSRFAALCDSTALQWSRMVKSFLEACGIGREAQAVYEARPVRAGAPALAHTAFFLSPLDAHVPRSLVQRQGRQHRSSGKRRHLQQPSARGRVACARISEQMDGASAPSVSTEREHLMLMKAGRSVEQSDMQSVFVDTSPAAS